MFKIFGWQQQWSHGDLDTTFSVKMKQKQIKKFKTVIKEEEETIWSGDLDTTFSVKRGSINI